MEPMKWHCTEACLGCELAPPTNITQRPRTFASSVKPAHNGSPSTRRPRDPSEGWLGREIAGIQYAFLRDPSCALYANRWMLGESSVKCKTTAAFS